MAIRGKPHDDDKWETCVCLRHQLYRIMKNWADFVEMQIRFLQLRQRARKG